MLYFPHVAHHRSLGCLDRKIRVSSQHAANTCSQLEAALRAYDTVLGSTAVFLLDTRRSVKLQTVPSEKAKDLEELAPHMKKVSGATKSSPAPPQSSASATPAWRSSLSDHFARPLALRKKALKMKNGEGDEDMVESCKATRVPRDPNGSAHIWPANPSLHAPVLCLDVSYTARRCAPSSSGGRRGFRYPETRRNGPRRYKLLFGYWLPYVLDPYSHWQFGFTVGGEVSDCLAIRYAVWERTYRAGWCISEQFWDVVKAFVMLSRPQLPRHPSFGCEGIGHASLSMRSEENVRCSHLVFEANRGEAQSFPWTLLEILRCRRSRRARGVGSAQVGATADVYLRAGRTSLFCSAFGYRRLR